MVLSRASNATAGLIAGSSTAVNARSAVARSPDWYGRATCRIRPAAPSSASAGVISGLTTVTAAPASSSLSIRRSATLPPPTTTQWRPARSRNIG
jgi:hypothetical protein